MKTTHRAQVGMYMTNVFLQNVVLVLNTKTKLKLKTSHVDLMHQMRVGDILTILPKGIIQGLF